MNKIAYDKKLQTILKKARSLRFQYTGRLESESYGIDVAQKGELYDIGGPEYSQYQWLVAEMQRMAKKATEEIIETNLTERKIEFSPVPTQLIGSCAFGFVISFNSRKVLVAFKDFGIANSLGNNERITCILKYVNADQFMYVSLVRDHAYLENIGHNENQSDPSRGTNIYSIKFFFERFFGNEETDAFLSFADNLRQEFIKCLGMRPIKTLSAYSLYGFKFIAERHLKEYTLSTETVYSKDMNKNVALTQDEIALIMNHYSGHSMLKAMTGKNDFAISFISAEWLFDSLVGSGTIDLSSIIMGYCKSVEQLLLKIIKFHVGENRGIKPNKGGASDRIPLTEEALCQYQVDTTWGALTHFLDDNRDLFHNEISEDGKEYIIVRLRQMNSKRNRYFHKENCYDWNAAIAAKEYVYQLLCLLLGSISFSSEQKNELEIQSSIGNDAFLQLCEYINYHANRPYYIREKPGEELLRVLSTPDEDFCCDNNGSPTYSGIYFHIPQTTESSFSQDYYRLLGKGERKKYTQETMPYQIFLADMRLVPMPDMMVISKPLSILWEDGKITIPERKEKIDY